MSLSHGTAVLHGDFLYHDALAGQDDPLVYVDGVVFLLTERIRVGPVAYGS